VAPAREAREEEGGGVGAEEGEDSLKKNRIFLIELTRGTQSTSANYATSALESGSCCQFEHQFVVNLILVDIATNLPYTCEILRFKRKPVIFHN
jgi:hypothetical protein